MDNQIINNFEKTLNELFQISHPYTLIPQLKKHGLDRVQLMILDSAIKGMPLENIWKTLLILEHKYYEMLKDATDKIYNVIKQLKENNKINK